MARVCDDDDACVEYRSNVLWNDKGKTTSPCVNCRRGAERMTARYKPDVDDDGVHACIRCGRKVSGPNRYCPSCAAHDREVKRSFCSKCGRQMKSSPGQAAHTKKICSACEPKTSPEKRAYNAEAQRAFRARQKAKKLLTADAPSVESN